ncbi:hypothetical protein CLTEP_15330 [Clostridium tepidiprofundi DSM 19306]|uniref:Uncharacterized protein n=1 Tax=Clostridium tepidiprofundi DSM 19306 TaxID=1121338 RepID=A0A151B3K0_9CLOT|nr:hypothetical protein [Clostridium tepidiprofundi]KYH34485.1 hypothetical protein CLTEP_15330 [Clostridium tepidiprofundi DSM 19306]
MGNYNAQYESYYKRLLNNRKSMNKLHKYNRANNKIANVLMRQLTGTLILFLIILFCKSVTTSATYKVYNFSKTLINKDYDYRLILKEVKSFDFYKFQDNVIDKIENIMCKININNPF